MRITLTWELGGGAGHATRIATVAHALAERGHEAAVVARRPEVVKQSLEETASRVPVLESPQPRPLRKAPAPRTWADVIMGGAWSTALPGYLDAWERAIQAQQPDIVVSDYAPTCDLAARVLGLPFVTLSDGFCRPAQAWPLPDLRATARMPGKPDTVADVFAGERRLLDAVNPLLREPIERAIDLYRDAPDLRCTFGDLDHLGPADGATYLGPFPATPHGPPRWPDTGEDAPKVFVYAKAFPRLRALFELLSASGLPTAAYIAGVTAANPPANVHVHDQPVDMAEVGRHADLVIGHGGRDMTTAMMQAGVPMLLIPQHLEQALVARRVEKLGTGVVAMQDDAETLREGLRKLLLEESYEQAAQRFASAHADHDPAAALRRAVQIIEETASV